MYITQREHLYCSNLSMYIAQMWAWILLKSEHAHFPKKAYMWILLKWEHTQCSNVSMHIAQIIWAYMLLKYIAKIVKHILFENICIVPFWDSVILVCCLWGTISRSLNLVEIIWNLSYLLLVCRDLVLQTCHCLKQVLCRKSLDKYIAFRLWLLTC